MDLDTWLAFVATSMVLLVIPGPTILLIVSYGMGQGARAALPTTIGAALGDLTAMTLSMLGIGALLAASATLFTVLKLAGAAYLIWLGVKLWRAGGQLNATPIHEHTGVVRMIGHAWVVTTLNPKGITFFVAFLPQFFNHAASFWMQMLVFEATFLALSLTNALAYALMASRARRLVRNERVASAFNRTGGSLLIGAGVMTAASRAT